jgi:3-hydroxybutyryl-CoA dehydratase
VEEIKVGDKATFSKLITEEDVISFAEITDDRNPLYLNEEYARKTRFGGRIVHSMLTASLISALLSKDLPGCVYLSQNLRFLEAVRIGDTITIVIQVIAYDRRQRVATLRTECFNQDRLKVLTGEAMVMLGENESQGSDLKK